MWSNHDGEALVLPYPRNVRLGERTESIEAVAIRPGGAVAPGVCDTLAAQLDEQGIPLAETGFRVCLGLDPALPAHLGREGYRLQVDGKGATIGAHGGAGLYHGAHALLQMFRPKGEGVFSIPRVEIVDWPLKPIRGIHTYLPGRSQLPFFKRFIQWLGRHGCNAIFLEIGGGMEYRRHPEINAAWEAFCREALAYPGGPSALQASQWFLKDSTHTELAGGSYLTQDEVRQIAGWCGENYIEIMPEVQSLSHAYYLVLPHRDLAEVAEDPWPDNYCPSNPKSYELYFDVLAEVIDVLQPSTLSIGHDEAYIFQFCPKCEERDAAEIFATDIRKTRDFLAERGVRTAMWGDKLLEIHHPDGRSYGGVERTAERYGRTFRMPATNRCVDRVPRDVLVLDWYWSLSYESAAMLAEKGFELIYGNYHGPNFQNWAKLRENPALLGGETSLWCAPDFYSIGRNGGFHNILWGMNNLWSDFDPDSDPDRLRHDIALTMRRDRLSLGGEKTLLSGESALSQVPADLGRAAAREGATDAGDDLDLGCLPCGRQRLGGVDFQLGGEAGAPRRFVGVDWHQSASPPVPIGRQADALCFLHTTNIDHVHAPTYYSLLLGPNIIGVYLLSYEDGTSEEVPLEYARNIDAFNTRFMIGKGGDQSATIGAYAFAADPVLAGETRSGKGYTVFMHEWRNPKPDTPLRDVRLIWKAGYSKGEIVLLALTTLSVAG